MAAVFCASLSRRAMVWRSRVIRTRSSRAASSGGDGARGLRRFGGIGRGRRSPGCEGAPLAIAASTSPFSTWPRLPDPATCSTARLFSASSLAAAGAGGISRFFGRGRSPATAAVLAAASLTVSAPAAPAAWATASGLSGCRPSSAGGRPPRRRRRSWPSSAPTPTVSPSLAAISASVPAAGAGTSMVTLSVSSSTSGSSAAIGVADLLEPLADGRLGDGFAERRDADFGRHVVVLSVDPCS